MLLSFFLRFSRKEIIMKKSNQSLGFIILCGGHCRSPSACCGSSHVYWIGQTKAYWPHGKLNESLWSKLSLICFSSLQIPMAMTARPLTVVLCIQTYSVHTVHALSCLSPSLWCASYSSLLCSTCLKYSYDLDCRSYGYEHHVVVVFVLTVICFPLQHGLRVTLGKWSTPQTAEGNSVVKSELLWSKLKS